MTLYIIGLGLDDKRDISLKGLEYIKKSDFVYLEGYTSVLSSSVEEMEQLYGKKVIVLRRKDVEEKTNEIILKNAKNKTVSFLVIGDPMAATTHIELLLEAGKKGIKTEVVHNASITSAVGITGLQIYKFGTTTSLPFPEDNFQPEAAYDVIKQNKKNGQHTLILLDLRPEDKLFMTVNQAVEYLLKLEKKRNENVFTEKTLCIGCARIGSAKPLIKTGTAQQLLKADFGKQPHCLIVPGRLHFKEEEAIMNYA